MLFNSMQYVIFFIITAVIYYILPKKIRYIWLLAASYYFYMKWEAKYAILILVSTLVTYSGALLIEHIRNSESLSYKKEKYGKYVLVLAVIINLGLLIYFKYINFIIGNINSAILKIGGAGSQISIIDVLLPVGISFFTFQAIGYVIDVYRGNITAERNFFRYALFVSFFPQLVAGPIERAKNLMGQLKKPRELTGQRLQESLLLMLVGLFQKVMIADNIAAIIDPVIDEYTAYPGYIVGLCIILFGFQIYCDFAGYTNIAIGSAKILGVNLMNNFEAPYFATSVSEFWRRWHISLTSWFRDYLYIPLGGNRKGKIRKHINTFIVFLVSGLWHGAAWKYVVWGGLNGVFIIAGDIKNKLFSKYTVSRENSRVDLFVKRIITFILVDFAWLFFRVPSLRHSIFVIRHIIFNNKLYEIFYRNNIFDLFKTEQMLFALTVSLIILFLFDAVQYKTGNFTKYILMQKEYYRWALYTIIVLLIIIYGAYDGGYVQTKFMYFQF